MNDALDAARYRWLKAKLESAVGGSLHVNEQKLYYETPEPGKVVALQWYPDTPVGFHLLEAGTLDDLIDAGRDSGY